MRQPKDAGPAGPGPSLPLYGAIDMGGTKTALAVVGQGGAVIRRTRFETPARPAPEALLDRIAAAWRALLPPTGEPGLPPIAAVGVAVPGPTDAAAGVLAQAFDWPWRDVPVAALLTARLGLPVRIENDVNCCCLAERAFGAARGVDDFAWVQLSTGVGAGLVLGGRLYSGAAGLAGELGHLEVAEGGPLCACGRRGCLQALVSGPAIARRWAEARGGAGEAPSGAAEAASAPGAGAVFSRCAAGDATAQALVRAIATDLGRGLAVLVNLLNPALVVLGGGVMESLHAHLPAVSEAMRARVIGEANRRIPVTRSAVGYDAALLGAAVLAGA